jgi:hypothetical protein
MFYKHLVAGIIRFNLLYFRILAAKQGRTFLSENASLLWCKGKFQSLPVWNYKWSDNHCPCEHRVIQTFYQIKFLWFNLNFEYKCNSGPICKIQLQIHVKTCLWYWILIHYFSLHISQIIHSRNKIIKLLHTTHKMIMANFIKLGYTVYCIHFLPDAGVHVWKISKQEQEAEVWGTLLMIQSE